MASNAGGICAAFTSRPREFLWEFLWEGEISFLVSLSLRVGKKNRFFERRRGRDAKIETDG